MPTFMAQIEAIPQVPQAFTLTWAEELRPRRQLTLAPAFLSSFGAWQDI